MPGASVFFHDDIPAARPPGLSIATELNRFHRQLLFDAIARKDFNE
jgi:hypothetical protein